MGVPAARPRRHDGRLGRRAPQRHRRAAAHAACHDHRSPRRQVPRRVELRRHRPRADVPGRSHGRLPRLARLGRRVLRLPRLAAPLWRGSRDRRVRVHSVALVRRRIRRVARARVPAPDHRLRPGDRRGRRVGRPHGDNRFRRVLLAPLALRGDAQGRRRFRGHRLLLRDDGVHARGGEDRHRRTPRRLEGRRRTRSRRRNRRVVRGDSRQPSAPLRHDGREPLHALEGLQGRPRTAHRGRDAQVLRQLLVRRDADGAQDIRAAGGQPPQGVRARRRRKARRRGV